MMSISNRFTNKLLKLMTVKIFQITRRPVVLWCELPPIKTTTHQAKKFMIIILSENHSLCGIPPNFHSIKYPNKMFLNINFN